MTTEKQFTRKEIDEMPKCDPSQPVMVRPYSRGQQMVFLDSEGYKWLVGEYEPGNYYKEVYGGW